MERLVCIFFFLADDCKNFKVNSSAIDRYFLSLQKIGCAWVLYAFFFFSVSVLSVRFRLLALLFLYPGVSMAVF